MYSRRTRSGVCAAASASMVSRHAQKSPPSVRPRSARWNAWQCAFTKPGIRGRSCTPVSFPHGGSGSRGSGSARADPERADDRASRIDTDLRRAHGARRPQPQLARRDRLRHRRDHRPGGRLSRAPLARRVALREACGPASRPAHDRRGRDPARLLRQAAVGGADRDHRPRRPAARRVCVPRAARRARRRGQPRRQGGHLDPLRRDRLPHRHAPLDAVAARPLLDRNRARPRGRRVVRLDSPEGTTPMKAVVMAGGEGPRLRPLTSNQPKPMVPIVGKPCMEHIVELLKAHEFVDIVVTLAFMPQAIRGYFGAGETHGVSIRYSVEEAPMGTAGSVKLAEDALDEPFLVISGDALCDIDLEALVRFHEEKEALVTIGLKSVDNPLEFGIVVTDEDGRVERFLEKPSWGQVFTDTINTGIYVLESEVLRHVPTDRPYDFSKELFPLLLEMGRPIYGFVLDGYWQDIGNLDQYRQANFDALDEKVRLDIPGIRLRGNIWVGESVELDELERIEGPSYIGNYSR